MFLNQNIVLILFITIIIVSVIVAIYMGDYYDYEKSSLHIFISIIIGLGVFITFLFYYNVILIQEQQQEFGTLQEISRINNALLNDVLDAMRNATATIPNFVSSLTPLSRCSDKVEEDSVNFTTCIQRDFLSFRIFKLWQDVITSEKHNRFEMLPYISLFLQYANSVQLYNEWPEKNRLNFNSETQILGDLLFEYGLPITEQVSESYERAASKLMKDPRFLQLHNY